MKLTAEELAWLDAETAAGRLPPIPPALPESGPTPTTPAMLLDYRRARLAKR